MQKSSFQFDERLQLQNRRGAILSMELVLILPIFLLLLFAIVEFSCIASAKSRISTAAQSATRQLCLYDAPPAALRQHVRKSLGPKLARGAVIRISNPPVVGQLANVEVVVPMANATPDLLWITGFSVSDRTLNASAPMLKETGRPYLASSVASDSRLASN